MGGLCFLHVVLGMLLLVMGLGKRWLHAGTRTCSV